MRGVLVVLSSRTTLREEQLEHFAKQRLLLSALNARRDELVTIIDVQLQLTVFVSDSSVRCWAGGRRNTWRRLATEFANFHPDDMNHIALVYYREIVRRNQNKALTSSLYREFRRRHRSGTWRRIRSESYILERDDRGNIKYLDQLRKEVNDEKSEASEAVRIVEALLNAARLSRDIHLIGFKPKVSSPGEGTRRTPSSVAFPQKKWRCVWDLHSIRSILTRKKIVGETERQEFRRVGAHRH